MKISLRHLPLTGLALVLAIGGLRAQGPDQETLKQRYEAKLKKAWYVDAGWTDDFGAAKERAKKEKKLVFTYFTRTYSP